MGQLFLLTLAISVRLLSGGVWHGDPDCFAEIALSWTDCCHCKFGAGGNQKCWDENFTASRCCKSTWDDALRGWIDDNAASNPLIAWNRDRRHGPGIMKYWHYLQVYHQYFAAFRADVLGRPPVIMEIGVYSGGSMLMWQEYFGPGTQVLGLDVRNATRAIVDQSAHGWPTIKIFIGDQGNHNFLRQLARRVKREVGPVDIIIDDGAHRLAEQVTSFEILFFNLLREGGVYLVEDIGNGYVSGARDSTGPVQASSPHASIKLENSFVYYASSLAHRLHAWTFHTMFGVDLPDDVRPSRVTFSLESVAFHNNIVVFRKKLQPRRHPHVSEATLCNGDLWLGKTYDSDGLRNWEKFYERTSDYPTG